MEWCAGDGVWPWVSCACGSAAGMTPFTSLTATIGRKRMNRRNSVKKRPNVPTKVEMSTMVGRK
ncbi:hypothetical protein D3C83_150250 [compost metagenome]